MVAWLCHWRHACMHARTTNNYLCFNLRECTGHNGAVYKSAPILRNMHSLHALRLVYRRNKAMLKLSLLLVAVVLLNRKLHRDFGWVCVSAVMVGHFWPSWLLIPYIVIVWRISKEFLESRRDSLQTQFPVSIGRRRSSPKYDQSVDWIVAVEVPPKKLLGDSPNRRLVKSYHMIFSYMGKKKRGRGGKRDPCTITARDDTKSL